ncbi:MAG TPA: 50S ribosomal protein L31e [Nitrososphaeraceae archaeon]|nr:50S ribosomal protein L31e [Nitrososphaeraceae archaeon]
MSKTEESLSRVYTINLGKAWLTPRYRRTDRVMNMVREFAIKNMKSDEVKIDQDLSRHIWARGKTNPPRKVRVKMVKDDDDIVTVSLYEEAIETEEDEEEKEDTKKAKGSSKKGTEDDTEEEGKDDESEEDEDKK